MAKFKTNHSKRSKGASSYVVRIALYGGVLLFLLYRLLVYFKSMPAQDPALIKAESSREDTKFDKAVLVSSSILADLPTTTGTNAIIHHTHYTLSYSEPHEQAEWVTYELTREELNAPKVGRFDYFSPDILVKTRSAVHRDYTGSGYTRGHLAPAADMAFDQKAAEESFYMSNMSPQEKYCNQGIWRELEENVRDWARQNKKLLIVTGPVLSNGIIKKIGENRVSVPSLFYKILLDTVPPEIKSVGFIIPNSSSDQPLQKYMVSVDSVEKITNIDFLNGHSQNVQIEELEKMADPAKWPIDPERFKKRVEVWNKRE